MVEDHFLSMTVKGLIEILSSRYDPDMRVCVDSCGEFRISEDLEDNAINIYAGVATTLNPSEEV